MDLNPYLETLRRDLEASAAPGGEDVSRAAALLAGSLEAAARLSLLEALSDAAAEITTKLDNASVEVRLRGRSADLVVSEGAPAGPPPPANVDAESGDVARITLRLPEALKASVEQAASAEGISVNAWLVRAISTAVRGGGAPSSGSRRYGRRVTGFAQA
ncbi:MAG TPA: toxin-antitoxin system HicB family antitoxin [Actinocatenispora sp.]